MSLINTTTVVIVLGSILGIFYFSPQQSNQPIIRDERYYHNSINQPSAQVAALPQEIRQVEKLTEEILLEQQDWDKKNNPSEEGSGPELASLEKDTIEVSPVVHHTSSIRQRTFVRGQSGAFLIDYVKGNPNGLKLWTAFYDLYGVEVADKAAIALYYENGSLWEFTTGVCSAKYQINGDYRNCNYADMNNGGMDAGLKQINTYWQRYRIAKLGGPSCEPANSRDIADPCTLSQVQWLHNVDNNIAIALDIYSEQGFQPWVGAQRAGIV